MGKHQRRLTGVDEIVLSLSAKGRTAGEIRDGEVANWPIYAAIGVTLTGGKEILGL